ncbi:hypothetical protein DB347_01135 [Opitutaceae bacterium EW11]|nr:hypothetical protein DB347_01135 [Opitutaceae bacterium EW11]
MDVAAAKRFGLFAAAGDLLDSVLNSARHRVQLLSVEVQEEKLRFIQLFIWVAAAAFPAVLHALGKDHRRIGIVGVALKWLPRFVRFAHAFSTSH